jgi:hypothetical protein
MLWFSGKSKQSIVLNSQAFIDAAEYITAQVLRGDLRTAVAMHYEHSSKYTPRPPLCPSCTRIMRFARASRFGDLCIQYVFECRACGVSHIEAAPFAVKLDATESNQSSEKASLPTLLGKLDVFEGSQLFRACKKRLRTLTNTWGQVGQAAQQE